MKHLRNILLMFVSGGICTFLVASLWSEAQEAKEAEKSPATAPTPTEDVSGLKAKVPSNEDLSQALAEKEEQIKKKEQALASTEIRLQEQQALIEKKAEELAKLQAEISSLYDKSKQREDEVFTKLLTSLQKMAPKKASAMIALMEDRLAVDVLLGMKEKNVANILNSMEANRAMTLSAKIAERKPATTFEKGRAAP